MNMNQVKCKEIIPKAILIIQWWFHLIDYVNSTHTADEKQNLKHKSSIKKICTVIALFSHHQSHQKKSEI